MSSEFFTRETISLLLVCKVPHNARRVQGLNGIQGITLASTWKNKLEHHDRLGQSSSHYTTYGQSIRLF